MMHPTHTLGPVPGKATCGALLGLSRIAGQAGAVLDCPDCIAEERRLRRLESERVKARARYARNKRERARRRARLVHRWRCEVAENAADARAAK